MSERALSGFELRSAEVSVSDTYEEFYRGSALPNWQWFDVTGRPDRDDVALNEHNQLTVSQEVYDILRPGLVDCEVELVDVP
ncbi:MAG: hypothetical protein M3Q27_07480 [Actinomycetota bacterium]|nr:hypothetical protein [Actinomycetota bacterium]